MSVDKPLSPYFLFSNQYTSVTYSVTTWQDLTRKAFICIYVYLFIARLYLNQESIYCFCFNQKIFLLEVIKYIFYILLQEKKLKIYFIVYI